MTRRLLGLCALLAFAALVLPAVATADVPVAVRLVKGSKAGPPGLDPRLEGLKRQLSPLAYVRWEQVSEQRLQLARGKPQFLELPGGDTVAITLEEQRGNTLTLEIGLTQRNTQSRLTVEKGQRIVHGVLPEKDGVALFIVLAAEK